MAGFFGDIGPVPDAGAAPDVGVVAPDAGVAPCLPASAPLSWPMPGAEGGEWVLNNYVDLEPSAGLMDYTGATGAGAKTYDGHNGLDLDVPNFRAMDRDYEVVAAAPGVVEEVVDDQFDRNLSCAGPNWNFVRVRHENGFAMIYGHFKQSSARVQVGDTVSAGQALAVVGSSGCSTQGASALRGSGLRCRGGRPLPGTNVALSSGLRHADLFDGYQLEGRHDRRRR